jgi:hypothetical protein
MGETRTYGQLFAENIRLEARVKELENSIWTMGERYAAKQARITALEEALRDISNYRGNVRPTPFWREIMRIVDTALAAAEKVK